MFENMLVKFKFDVKMNLIDKNVFCIKKYNELNINWIYF